MVNSISPKQPPFNSTQAFQQAESPSVIPSVDGDHQKEEVKYPEFGQVIEDPHRLSLKQKAWTVAKVGLVALSFFAIAATVGGLPIGIAAGVVLVSLAVYQIGKKIFSHYSRHRYRLAFEPGANNSDAPKLGEYRKVDLRVSNHAAESFEWKKALIASAKDSIELSANFAGGENFREVLQLIERRMTEYPNLKCHIILSSDLLEQQDLDYLENLKQIYPHFNCLITDRIYTLSPELLSEENHVKMLVVDGQYFVMGGTGIHEKMTREESPVTPTGQESLGSKMIDKAFRDTDLIGYGDVAQTMRNQFFNLYRIWEHRMTGADRDHYFPNDPTQRGRCELFHEEEGLIKESTMKYVIGGPEHRQKNPISTEIAKLTREATEDIKVANLLFNPDDIMSDAFKEAKDKGISIEGYFNGTSKGSSTAHYLYALPNRFNYTLVTKAFEYRKKDQLYHKKVMTVDSRYTVIGSFNFGRKSTKCDYENVCVIDDSRVAQLMNATLKHDAADSKLLTGERLTKKRRWSILPSLLTIGFLGNLFG